MTDRRSFLAALAATPVMTRLADALPVPTTSMGDTAATSEWDLTWLDGLTGKHKQVFDVEGMAIPLIVVANYLRGFREVMNLEHPNVMAVVGLASAYAINAADWVWEKYRLGERHQIKDPDTGAFAVRNTFALRDPMPTGTSPEHTVQGLQKRGAIFWQCNNAINHIAGQLAATHGVPVDQVRKDLLGGLLPGVKLVPAHTMLVGLAQERGCTYEKL